MPLTAGRPIAARCEAQLLASLNHSTISAIDGVVDAGSADAFPEPDPAHAGCRAGSAHRARRRGPVCQGNR